MEVPNARVFLSEGRGVNLMRPLRQQKPYHRRLPLFIQTTSFTLAGIDPANITNLNEGAGRLPPPPPRPGAAKGPRNKGRRGRDPTPSSDSEDMMSRGGRRPLPQTRGKPRGAIKFSGAVAPKGPSKSQQKSQGFRGSSRGGGNRGRGASRGGRGRRGK